MKTKLLNAVMTVNDYEGTIEWYQSIFDLDIIHQDSGAYHYTELGQNGQNIVGIAKADEMDHKPTNPKNNSCVLQVQVEDIEELYERVKKAQTEIRFGPSKEEKSNFAYGAISDPEGNEIWIICYPSKE